MSDDEMVEAMKRHLGVKPSRQQPAELLIAVNCNHLHQLIASAMDAIGTARGFGLVIGESGRPLVNEMDRFGRDLRYRIGDLLPTP